MMLFEFDLNPNECEEADQAILTNIVSELCRSHRLGYHLAVIRRDTANWLRDNLSLSGLDRGTLKRIAAEYTQSGGLKHVAAVFTRVKSSHFGPPVRLGNEIQVGIEGLAAETVLNRAILLVEDQTRDGRFYGLVLDARRGVFQGGSVEFEKAHGGGEQIHEIANDKVRDERIVVVIADSDRKAPADRDSLKTVRLKQVLADWPFGELIELPCQEIENLLNADIVHSLPCIHGHEPDLQCLLSIDEAQEHRGDIFSDRFWLYFDFKSGVRLPDVHALKNDDVRAWILDKIDLAGSPCSISGFGNGVIPSMLANGATHRLLREHVRSKRFENVFGSHFERTAWMGIAAQPQRT